MTWRPMWTDMILSGISAGGLGLFLHHVAYYCLSMHLAPIDHGAIGVLMLLGGVSALIARHPPRKGGKRGNS